MTMTPIRPAAVPPVGQLPRPEPRRSTEIQGNILAAFNKDFTDFRHLHLPDDGEDRGLMFVRYGTSLEKQFELVQPRWSNSDDFPPGEGRPGQMVANGFDKVTGLAGKASVELADDTSGTVDTKRLVRTTGALYAFTPSVGTLRLLAGGKDLPNEPVGS